MRGICCCWLMLIFLTIFVSCHSFLFWIRSELGADCVDFARAVAWVLRFWDLRTAEGIQVVARDLCSLCWSCGVALAVFGVGFVLLRFLVSGLFSWRCLDVSRDLCLGVWTCGLCNVALFC